MPPKTNCACNCAPCACPSPSGEGCLPDLCVPRPCFFDGQLIASDDLNAIVSHARARELTFGRFVGGWGVYGGLVVDAAPGVPHERLRPSAQMSPNPQILAGTTVQVSAGVAIDANGRSLVQCGPAILDLAAMAAEAPRAPETRPCTEWVEGGLPACEKTQADLTATEYWLVAEYDESPSRPAPQFSGGGACDPAPTCDYTRKRELVRYALVPPPPSREEYQFTGCLERLELPEIEADIDTSDRDERVRAWYEVIDVMNSALAHACCGRPAVMLARVLFVSAPGDLRGTLPSVPVYTILDDGYPLRRIVASSALNLLATLSLGGDGGGGGGSGPIAQARFTDFGEGISYSGYGIGGISRIESDGDVRYEVALQDPRSVSHRVVHATHHHSEGAAPPFVQLAPLIVDGGGDTILVRFLDEEGMGAAVSGFGLSVFDAERGGGS